MLLVLGVAERAVMDVMGWSKIDMAQRYMHVPDNLRQSIASQVGGLLWGTPADKDDREHGRGAVVAHSRTGSCTKLISGLPRVMANTHGFIQERMRMTVNNENRTIYVNTRRRQCYPLC